MELSDVPAQVDGDGYILLAKINCCGSGIRFCHRGVHTWILGWRRCFFHVHDWTEFDAKKFRVGERLGASALDCGDSCGFRCVIIEYEWGYAIDL